MASKKKEGKLEDMIPMIADQHKMLRSHINALDLSIKAGKDAKAITVVVNRVIRYAKLHFKAEEDYLDVLKVECASAHAKEHQVFLRKVLGFKERYKAGDSSALGGLHKLLVDWSKSHIENPDEQFGHCLHEHGLR